MSMSESNSSTLQLGTLNLLCGGPSAGKTTLVYQSILAHERHTKFFIKPLHYPAGPILVINTDRSKKVNDQFFAAIGITNTDFISIVDDRELHNLTKNRRNIEEHECLRRLRDALTERILKLSNKPSTVILDLYGDFISGQAGNHKALGYDGRTNVQWAEDLNVAILGLAYPYKQKTNNQALRIQDRIAGATALQASSNWKLNITDASETKTCWIIDCIPPPMGGKPQTYYGMRADDLDGIGRFHECDPPPQETIDDVMEQNGISRSQAFKYKVQDFNEWLEKQKKKSEPS